MSQELECFKAYDVRGQVPKQLNADIARRIGRAYAQVIDPGKVVVGHDIRLSSPEICAALVEGLRAAGVDVVDIGQCGTEEIYFATSHLGVGGGIAVTASHNPKDYNGMKFVREESKAISSDSGLLEIKAAAEKNEFEDAAEPGGYEKADTRAAYIEHLLGYADVEDLRPLKIVVNAGNGGAGPVIDALEPKLPFTFVKVHHEPDGNFPNGVPNPLLEENRAPTVDAILEHDADLGVAWDGDFDRCFLFDAQGRFVEGYYVVGLLAEVFLSRHPGEPIVHDPRLTWNTIDIVRKLGGHSIQSKTGHAFIKERMRKENAIYGGEMSAHHYFRDFAFCDSGMIPWLMVTHLMSATEKSLAELVAQRTAKYPCSGEINATVEDAKALLKKVEKHYKSDANSVDKTDGLSMEFDNWRFNLRMSNTEPVVRLNVESLGDTALMQSRRDELLEMIGGA